MKTVLAFLLGLLPMAAGALAPCPWGVSCTIPIKLYEPDGVDLATTSAIAVPAGDITVSCNDNTESAGTAALGEGGVYSFTAILSAAQTQCERLNVSIRDQDATAAYLAKDFNVDTCGNASAAQVNCTSGLAPASTALSSATWTNARAGYLDNLNGHTPQTGDNYAILNTLTEDVAGLRYTAKALETAPTGSGGGPVDLNPDQQTVTIGTCNTVTNPVTAGTVTDKDDYSLAPSQAGVSIGTCGTIGGLQQSALQDFFADSGLVYASAVPGSVVYEIAENAQTAALTEDELAIALGGFIGTINTVTNQTTFEITPGPASADSINDEYTASIRDATNGNIPSCHRQVVDYVPPGTLVIDSQCPAGFTVAAGDSIVVLPNGTGALVPTLNVTNGAVETDLTVAVDGSLSLGCMLSAINAVQTGAQAIVGGTDYTYRNPGDTEDRVVASRTASGRTQATITCPAGL